MTVIRFKKLEHPSAVQRSGNVIPFPRAGNAALAVAPAPRIIELVDVVEEAVLLVPRQRKATVEKKILREEAKRAFLTYVITMIGLAALTFF